MLSTKMERVGGPRSRSTSCAPTFIEEARLKNRQVRLAKSRYKLRKFSELSHLEECSDTCDYTKERVCVISNSSDDLQADCAHTSKSCSSLITSHGRLGGSVEVSCTVYCITRYQHKNTHTLTYLGGTCGTLCYLFMSLCGIWIVDGF